MKKTAWLILIAAVIWTGASYFIETQGNRNRGDLKASSAGQNKHEDEGIEHKKETLPYVGYAAPAFSLKSIDGETFSVREAEGKPLVINFWNSWCGPCKKETPELVDLYDRYKGEFQLYGVNITVDDVVGDVRAFVQHFNMNYPVLLDRTGDVSRKYRVIAIPTTYFINRHGIIVDKATGYMGPGGITKKIKALIKDN